MNGVGLKKRRRLSVIAKSTVRFKNGGGSKAGAGDGNSLVERNLAVLTLY